MVGRRSITTEEDLKRRAMSRRDGHSRYRGPRQRGPRTWRALVDLLKEIGPFALGGLAGAFVLLVLFARLSEDVFSQEISSLDNNALLWVHSFANPVLDGVFKALSTGVGVVGVTVLAIAGFALLLVKKRPHDAWRWALVL